jgi:hypothetical protein
VEGLVRDCGEDFWEKSTAAEHIECSTGRTELASHARYNHDIRNDRFPACHVARSALGHAFDRDGIWDTRWPCCLRGYLRHEPDYGPLRFVSGTATFLAGKNFHCQNELRLGTLSTDDSMEATALEVTKPRTNLWFESELPEPI